MIHPKIPNKFNLTGVTFNKGNDNTQHNIDVVTLCCEAPLSIIRESENPYDSNAIRVVAWDQFHLGYIPKAYNVYLAPLMDCGRQFEVCDYQRIQHPDHQRLGISIELKEVV